jgi:hypothetical protein
MTAAPSGSDGVSPMPRANARAVALDPELTHTALRVYTYLQSTLGYKLPLGIAQKHIAQELGVSVKDVDAALRQLRIKGIIEQTRDTTTSKTVFRFNSSFGNRASELPATEPEPKPKMTLEQEMLAMGAPTLFESLRCREGI